MIRVLLFIALGWSAWGNGVLAQIILTAPAAPPLVSPTQTLTLVFDLKNNSAERDRFEFALELPEGLQLIAPPEPVELAPGEDEKIFISLLITARARAGAHTIRLKARSQKNPALTAQASVTITIKEVPGLQVSAPAETSVEPGSALLLKFTVRNTGNAPDRLELSLATRAGISARLSSFSRLDLAPGESREVQVEIFIPQDAPPVRERVTLRAVSQRFANVMAEATAFISVLPPLPHQVGGSLFLAVPSQVQFRFTGQTGVPVSALVNIQNLGGVLIPDVPAVHIDVGGAVSIDNNAGVAITVTVSDGRPPVVILAGNSDSFVFSDSNVFWMTLSGGALVSSTIIITVHDLILRQTLQGGGPIETGGKIFFLLDLQNLFQLNSIFFSLDVQPVGFALGDLRPSFGTLASLSGRGGQIVWQPGLFDTKLSLAGVAGLRTLSEAELRISDDLGTLPALVTVRLHQPVRLRNIGLLPHSVTIPGFGTQILAPGQSFVHIFNAVGQVLVTIDTVTVPFTVLAGSFCDAPFIFCAALGGETAFIKGLSWSSAGLLGFSSNLVTTVLSRLLWEIPAGSSTAVEGGMSFQNGVFLDSAFRLGSQLRLGDFAILAQFLRAGRHFVGDRHDEQSLQVFQSFTGTVFSFSGVFERARNNVNNDPLQQTLIDQNIRAALGLKLAEIFPQLRLAASYRTRQSLGPGPIVNLANLVLSLRLTQPLGRNSDISFFTDQTQNINFVLASNTGFGTAGTDFSLRFNELRASLRIERRTQIDLHSGLILSQTILAAAGLEWLQRPFALRFGWTSTSDRLDLTVGLEGTLGLLVLSFFARTSFLAPSGLAFDFSLSVTFNFAAPIPFIVTKGRVEGFLFVDANGNGRRDQGETGLKNIILVLDNQKARTDETGLYRFPPLAPGNYRLSIEKLPLDVVATVPLPKEISLRAGQILQLEIPLSRVAVIEGVVFHDANRNAKRDADEGGLERVKIFLTDGAGKTRDQFTDAAGRFAFSELLPGDYTVALDARSLPENFTPTTPAEVHISLKPQERLTVNFGAAERPKVVKFPPVADFSFAPASPKAGEKVLFDAAESFDPDGQIVKYEWDFTSDGTIDAQGVKVEHSFPQPGDYTVTLRVTDNDGEQSTARKTVRVGP